MSTPTDFRFRALCAEPADELELNRRCLLGDVCATHPLAERARAALAEQQQADVCIVRALVKAEAALADIGDSEREPGDDLAWCERRAAEALPVVREALAFASQTATPAPDEVLPPKVGHILRLAEIIREVDGNHDKGAAALAEAILSHPDWRMAATPAPVLVAERLPEVGDCIANPRNGEGLWCWGWVQHDPSKFTGRWRMIRVDWLVEEAACWLPHWALPLPEVES